MMLSSIQTRSLTAYENVREWWGCGGSNRKPIKLYKVSPILEMPGWRNW